MARGRFKRTMLAVNPLYLLPSLYTRLYYIPPCVLSIGKWCKSVQGKLARPPQASERKRAQRVHTKLYTQTPTFRPLLQINIAEASASSADDV